MSSGLTSTLHLGFPGFQGRYDYWRTGVVNKAPAVTASSQILAAA